MISLQERIERSAISRWGAIGVRLSWSEIDEQTKDRFRRIARDALEAAFPELFADPPTGWIAPWHLDVVMWTAAPDYPTKADWEAMRDNWLSRTA